MSWTRTSAVDRCLGGWLFPAISLFMLNALICRQLFRTEYMDQLDSIEGSFIAIVQWIRDGGLRFHWFPTWYGGIPSQSPYPPVFHTMAAIVAYVSGSSPASAYHFTSALVYCLGPVTLFLFLYYLSSDTLAAFAAGVFSSLVSFTALMLQEISLDMGTALGLRRLHVLIRYGEAPHLASLVFLPLAMIALHGFLKRPGPARLILVALLLAMTVLSNWIGAFALTASVIAYLTILPTDRLRRGVLWALMAAIAAYSLAAPWIPPSTILAVSHNAQETVGRFPLGSAQAVAWALIGGMVLVVRSLAQRSQLPAAVQFALYFVVLLGIPTMAAHLAEVYLMPQPRRYHIELDLGLSILAGFCFAGILRQIRSVTSRMQFLIRILPIAALAILAAVQLFGSMQFASRMIRPIAVESRLQYIVALKCREHLAGRRVFASGSVRFWLNAFSDTPQLGGGFDQAIVNTLLPHVYYGVQNESHDGRRAIAWLRIFGVSAVVVSDSDSAEPYQDYKDPRKFADLLPVMWTNGADTIYSVEMERDPMVRIVPASAVIQTLHDNYLTVEPIEEFLLAAERQPASSARLTWESPDRLSVSAILPPDSVVTVAVTYHPGWSASANGRAIELRSDALGQVIIDPQTAGPVTIMMAFDGGTEMLVARLFRAFMIVGVLCWCLGRLWTRAAAGIGRERVGSKVAADIPPS